MREASGKGPGEVAMSRPPAAWLLARASAASSAEYGRMTCLGGAAREGGTVEERTSDRMTGSVSL